VDAGDELIRVALAFVGKGAAADANHDCVATGSVPFVFPLTPDTRKAFGLEGGENGLMIGMQPSAEVFAKFVSGEMAGFSIFGSGERIEVVEPAKSAPIPAPVAPALPLASDASTADPVLRPIEKEVQRDDNAPSGTEEDIMSKEFTDKIAQLEGELQTAKALGALNDAERGHYAGLDAVEKSAFLAMGKTARAEQVTKAADADPVVFKSADGTEYRKSDGKAAELAKSLDDERTARLSEVAKREEVELRKRADETLKHMLHANDGHIALLKAVEGIADETARKAAMATLRASNEAAGMAFTRVGFTAKAAAPGSPDAQLDAMADAIAKEKGVSKAIAQGMALATPEGAALYNQAEIAKRAARA
jgi:hypothetical protein